MWIFFSLLFSLHAGAAMPKDAVSETIDAWHKAAAEAKEELYFSFFTADAVFLGTDPKERWTRDEFRAYAHPHFAKGKAWEMRAGKRFVYFSKDKKTAWFDEDLESKGLGPVRGSGVLVLEGAKWKIAQYNLSIPVWNEKFAEVRMILDSK